MATLSELFLALLLALGLPAPGMPAGDQGFAPLGVAVAAEDSVGNFTEPPEDDEKGGTFDPSGFSSPPQGEGSGDTVSTHGPISLPEDEE